jgi:hypothetical protein
MLRAEPVHRLAWCLPFERDDEAAVDDRIGRRADHGHELGAPRGEDRRLAVVSHAANDARRVAGVARVDDAAELGIVMDERVALVEQQRGMEFIDRAVERRGRDVADRQGAARESADDFHQPRLPTAFRRAREEQEGQHVHDGVAVREDDPQHDRPSRVDMWQDDVAADGGD